MFIENFHISIEIILKFANNDYLKQLLENYSSSNVFKLISGIRQVNQLGFVRTTSELGINIIQPLRAKCLCFNKY